MTLPEEDLKSIAETDLSVLVSEETSSTHLTSLIAKQKLKVAAEFQPVIRYLASMAAFLTSQAKFDEKLWKDLFTLPFTTII